MTVSLFSQSYSSLYFVIFLGPVGPQAMSLVDFEYGTLPDGGLRPGPNERMAGRTRSDHSDQPRSPLGPGIDEVAR